MLAYQKIVWIGVAVTAVAILVLGYILFLAPRGAPKTPSPPDIPALAESGPEAAADVSPAEPDAAALNLELDDSDEAVRGLVGSGALPPALREWLRQKELVRTVVVMVDNIARGESPAAQLEFMSPSGAFATEEKGAVTVMAARGFRRYDPLVGAFTAVPDTAWIQWYRALRPTLEKAFRELGYPGITFAQRMQQAIGHLLQVPVLRQDAALEKKVVSYAFADPNLEALTPAQKHLLRMGPDNVSRVQKKLRSLAAALQAAAKK
ncbi:MAG: DUF3014 domain-containing protein [Candidatus Aminicenantes bacterium]|nr:DUF3014 domain-containing protein [Candidatus Aminicenantes bacterium]